MGKTGWTLVIEAAPVVLGVAAYLVGLVFCREATHRLLKRWRLALVIIGVLCFQVMFAHEIYMVGFDRGRAGEPKEDAYVSFYVPLPYIESDRGFTAHDFAGGYLLSLLACNSAFVILMATERREAAQRSAAVAQAGPPSPPAA